MGLCWACAHVIQSLDVGFEPVSVHARIWGPGVRRYLLCQVRMDLHYGSVAAIGRLPQPIAAHGRLGGGVWHTSRSVQHVGTNSIKLHMECRRLASQRQVVPGSIVVGRLVQVSP